MEGLTVGCGIKKKAANEETEEGILKAGREKELNDAV